MIIQTAFPGDVILATAIVEQLHETFPAAAIDFLLRKGNETLLDGNPHLRNVLSWDKKRNKILNLLKVIARVRSLNYDIVINLHRFASSGLVTIFSGGGSTVGFDKNPLSFLFDRKIPHVIGAGIHEIDRNYGLVASFADAGPARPKLFPGAAEMGAVEEYKKLADSGGYVCVAPASVWFTKQFPPEKWVELLGGSQFMGTTIFLIGASGDKQITTFICGAVAERRIIDLAGKLTFLESAALMAGAKMNYTNDSAPTHLASAMNAPVTTVFCSTVPEFGFGPLSDESHIVQTKEKLSCKPCGLHGYKACPLGHFKCALTITTDDFFFA